MNTAFIATMNLNGAIESLTKTVPVLHIPQLTVLAYPESGDLICDVDNRVYLTVVNEKSIAVNSKGRLENLQGVSIAEVDLQSDGRGVIEKFIPRRGERYQFRITPTSSNPEESIHPLPLSCIDGVRMSLTGGLNSGSIAFSIFSKTAYSVRVTLYEDCVMRVGYHG